MKNPTKIWLLMLISAIVSFLIFFLALMVTGRIGDKGYNLNDIKGISNAILNEIQADSGMTAVEIGDLLEDEHTKHPGVRLEWVSAEGHSIYDTEGLNTIYTFEILAERLVGMPQSLWGSSDPITLTYSTAIDEHTYFLIISLSSEAMKEGQIYFFVRSFSVLTTLLIPIIIAFIIPYIFSAVFVYAMNKRINRLNYAMSKFNLKSESAMLIDNKQDEIGQLISHYNEMAQRIQQQSDEIKQFEDRRKLLLSNLSHDLRTPLTMILGYAETIRMGLYKDELELQSSAKILLQRSRYMNKLLDQLLDISRQDEEDFKLLVAVHNVSELLRKVTAEYIMYLEGQGFVVEVNIPDEDIYVSIDAALIERAVVNILDNAIRYGSDGKYLEIGLTQLKDKVIISIMDKGRGITVDEQQHVFERFYRVNSSRHGEGLGIGLSIVKEIVEFHGGTIKLSSVPQRTVFEIHLPMAMQNISS